MISQVKSGNQSSSKKIIWRVRNVSGTNLLTTLEAVKVHLFPSSPQQHYLENVLRSFNDQIFVCCTCKHLVSAERNADE